MGSGSAAQYVLRIWGLYERRGELYSYTIIFIDFARCDCFEHMEFCSLAH